MYLMYRAITLMYFIV